MDVVNTVFTGNDEATGGSFPTQIRTKAEQRFPENVKWLRFLRVALRNEALSRSKKHDAGSSEFWQVYFHRSGSGGGGGTRCPRTVTAFAEVSSRQHQIGPFDAIPTMRGATFSAGAPRHGLRSEADPAIQACHRKSDFPSLVFLQKHVALPHVTASSVRRALGK